jgi:hypothetical protein
MLEFSRDLVTLSSLEINLAGCNSGDKKKQNVEATANMDNRSDLKFPSLGVCTVCRRYARQLEHISTNSSEPSGQSETRSNYISSMKFTKVTQLKSMCEVHQLTCHRIEGL